MTVDSVISCNMILITDAMLNFPNCETTAQGKQACEELK